MAEEKKRVALVRCEFDGKGGVTRYAEIDCNGMQLLEFVSKTLEIVAKILNKDPEYVAEMALFVGKFRTSAKAESENGEES